MTSRARPGWVRLRGECETSLDLIFALNIRSYPVNVDDIATVLGIAVHHVGEPGWEGACRSSESRADVWIRAESPRLHQRFVLAYEIAHLMLHAIGVEFRDLAPGTAEDLVSKQTTAYALALLMPRSMIYPLMHETRASIATMAAMFDVHETHAALRVRYLLAGDPEA